MNIKVVLTLMIFTCISATLFAKDIAYGTIKGIKIYDFPDSKLTKIYFNSDAIYQNEPSCEGAAVITHSLHSEEVTQKMISVALAGYMSGKKVRAYSHTAGSCEADLLSVQDSYF